MTKQIMYDGKLRDESDTMWTDDWNFDDEVNYREKRHLSTIHDR